MKFTHPRADLRGIGGAELAVAPDAAQHWLADHPWPSRRAGEPGVRPLEYAMKPKHCQYQDPKEPMELVEDLLNSPEKDEVYFVVSDDFWELEDQDRYEEIYDNYRTYFEWLLADIAERYGQPTYRGRWEDPSFPDWAVGEEIAVWSIDGRHIYLRIHHEDREVPILVALTRCEA